MAKLVPAFFGSHHLTKLEAVHVHAVHHSDMDGVEQPNCSVMTLSCCEEKPASNAPYMLVPMGNDKAVFDQPLPLPCWSVVASTVVSPASPN